MGVVDDGPGFHAVEWAGLDRHHGFRRPLVVLVMAFGAEFVPAFHRGSEHFRIDVDLGGDVFERVAFLDPTFVDLGEIVRAPTGVVAFIVDDGNADGAELSAFFVEDQIAGDARIVLNVGVIIFQRPGAGVLGRRRVLVHEALARFVDADPDHLAVLISRSGPDMADREGQVGKFKTVTAVKMPHMPEAGAGLLRHLQSVAGVAEIDRIDRLGLEILQLEGIVVFIAAAGEDDALIRLDTNRLAVMLGDQADHCAVRVQDQFFRRCREHHFDVALVDVVVDDFEQPRAAAQSFGPGKLLVGLEVLELDRVNVVGAGKWIGAVAAGFGLGRLGSADFGEFGDPVDHADHLFGHLAQNVVRRGAVAGPLQILKSAFGIMRESDAAAGENRDAARVGHLLDQ